MIVDVNGLKKPNKIGEDIFGAIVLPDRLIPYELDKLPEVFSGDYCKGYQNSATYLKN